MNFHRKLLLSEVEVLQLTPLEHLRFRKNRNSSGLLTEKTCFTLNPRSFQPGLFTVCSNLFWKKMQWVRRRRRGGIGAEKEELVREEDLIWSSMIRSRPGSRVHRGSQHWMISLWRSHFLFASFPILWQAKPSWARKVPSRRTPKHMCILNPPRRREAESSEVVGAHHL